MIEHPAALRASTEMRLPVDFARRVLIEARAQRKRRLRNRGAGAVACGALLIGLTFALGNSSRVPVRMASSVADSYVLQTQWNSSLEQLDQAEAPDQVDDYLTPAAASWSTPDISDATVYAGGGFDWQG